MLDIVSHPLCVLGTDGLIGKSGENPHPRAFGSTGHFYDLLVRQKGLLTPEQAIRKMSGQTAEFFHLERKGHILDGMDADVLLLNFDAFCDTATYSNGSGLTRGIEHMFVGGREITLPEETM